MGYQLNRKEAGSGLDIVLIPGLLGSVHFWDKIASTLSASHHVIWLELLGFAHSPKPKKSDYSLDEQVESVWSTIRPLVKNPIVVGHSMGALVAIELAKRHPKDIKKLILVSPPLYATDGQAQENISKSIFANYRLIHGSFARFSCNVIRFFNPLFQFFTPFFFPKWPRGVVSDFFLHTWESFSKSLDNVIIHQHALEDIGNLKLPIEIIYGNEDDLMIEDNFDKLKEKENISILKTAGTHMLPLENPEIVIRAID